MTGNVHIVSRRNSELVPTPARLSSRACSTLGKRSLKYFLRSNVLAAATDIRGTAPTQREGLAKAAAFRNPSFPFTCCDQRYFLELQNHLPEILPTACALDRADGTKGVERKATALLTQTNKIKADVLCVIFREVEAVS